MTTSATRETPRVAMRPRNPTPGHVSRETCDLDGHIPPGVHCSTVYNRQDTEQPKCPSTEGWIKKMWYMYISLKKNEIMPFSVICMGLDGVVLSEVSQTEKYKHHMTSLMCGI